MALYLRLSFRYTFHALAAAAVIVMLMPACRVLLGATPQRHGFDYPRGLADPPRHSLILTQFRKDYIMDEAMNTPIPNLSFTESEVRAPPPPRHYQTCSLA